MRVTLYIPCYNAGKYIGKCLEGVMNQTHPIHQILVIDDGSTDDTVKIASEYQVDVIRHEENKGLAAARNTAVNNAEGEFIASLDADCVPRKDWLEKLMLNFTDDKTAGVGGMPVEKHSSTLPDKWRSIHMKQHWGDKKVSNPPFLFGSNNVFRVDAIKDVGGYNEKYKTNYEDVDICIRLYERGFTLIYEPEAAVEHMRQDSISSVLRTYWRWQYPATCTGANRFKLYADLILSDLTSYRFSLIPVDLLLPLFYSRRDLNIILN